jgi:ABC-type transporter Mla subunit MlaD
MKYSRRQVWQRYLKCVILPRGKRGFRAIQVFAFVLLGGGVMVGLMTLEAFRQGMLEPQMQLRIRVPDAKGLRPGSRVSLSGVQVGVLRRLEVQDNGDVMLHFTIPGRYRGVVSPRSTVSIDQDFLLGDLELQVQAAPELASTIPESFAVSYVDKGSLQGFVSQAARTMAGVDQMVASLGSSAGGELPKTTRQLRGSLQKVDRVSEMLLRELPNASSTLQVVGDEAVVASRELIATLRQIRPQLSEALKQVDLSAEEAEALLRWINELIKAHP